MSAAISETNNIRIEVDRDLCFGFGDCVDSAPGVFAIDGEDVAIVVDPSAQDKDTIILAAQDCPVDSIFVWDNTTGEELYP